MAETGAAMENDAGEPRLIADPATLDAIALARLAATGDAAATSRLLRSLASRVVRVVRAVLGGSHPDVDDVSQQALIGFIQALPAFRGDSDPARYATTIAVRTAIAARRRTKVDRSRRDDEADAETVATAQPGPGEEIAAQRRKEILRGLLAELPTEQAEALAMRVVLGWSLEEIAVQSGAPLNTVRSRLRLAKESLRRTIEAQPGLCEALEVDP
ncbi:MAG TPA: sigma-70 family RNA polymerase sigma factor [Labilithrix sp.]|nr:sigma-70 family RNA polymerase sigma factor [Labilithrix sp.]